MYYSLLSEHPQFYAPVEKVVNIKIQKDLIEVHFTPPLEAVTIDFKQISIITTFKGNFEHVISTAITTIFIIVFLVWYW